jgi:hypothetical protein
MAALSANPRLLRHITIDAVALLPEKPIQKIRTDEDLAVWRTTTGYRDFVIFLQRLNEAVVGHMLPWSLSSSSQVGWTASIPENIVLKLARRRSSPHCRC